MSHSTGRPRSRYLFAVLALVGPQWSIAGEIKLAIPFDPNPPRKEAVSRSREEPKPLALAAEAVPLPADIRNKPLHSGPAVRAAAPFNPTVGPQPQSKAKTKSVREPSIATAPRPSGFVKAAERDPVARQHALDSSRQSAPSTLMVALPRNPTPVVKQAPRALIADSVLNPTEVALPERNALEDRIFFAPIPKAPARPVIQLAERPPLLAILQPSSPSASDLPAPPPAPLSMPTEDEIVESAIAEEIEAFELDVKPINQLTVRTKPESGEMPANYATARFAREGEVAHHMGYSRTQMETEMMWEAPALCHRPLYFEDINLERHGYKIPLIQPAVSAAHFFGRVPLLPYMMVSEGHRKCQYTLGHYRPGDYAPYSLYIPRLRLDASAAEAAVVAAVIIAFP